MKHFILLGLFFLVACNYYPQNETKNKIEKYIKQQLNNPDSIEFISVNGLTKDWHQTPLDSDIMAWSEIHQVSKFDHKAIEICVDSLNKLRPDLAQKNNRNLKLIESGKLDYYWTNCTFTIINNGQKKLMQYVVQLDTNYKIINAKTISAEKQIVE